VDFQVNRARDLFASGLFVTQSIPRTSAICVRTMAGIYQKLLDEIEANPGLPLQRRASLSPLHKLGVAAHAWLVPR
jgi:phytoene synthase